MNVTCNELMKMPDIPDLSAVLQHVYWLGGASGAAKSTIARRLAETYDMALYSTDAAMAAQSERCTPAACPQLHAFRQMTMDERWVNRTPSVMLDSFHWFLGEGFPLILEDLLAFPRDRKIIVEGFRALPRLVKPVIASPHQAVWLITTPAFRRKAFEARGTLWDIPNKTSQPEKALQNLLARDALFTDRLKGEAEQNGTKIIRVDGSRSKNELFEEVKAHFRLRRNHVQTGLCNPTGNP